MKTMTQLFEEFKITDPNHIGYFETFYMISEMLALISSRTRRLTL